jgi:H+-transporting ATPase
MSFFILFAANRWLHLSLEELRTLVFLTLVFTGQATIYLIRERNHFWHSRPSSWMITASIADILIVSLMAIFGILMAPLSPCLVFGLLVFVAAYFGFLDFLKTRIPEFFRL